MQNDLDLNNIIRFEHAGKTFAGKKEPSLKDVSFAVHAGEFVCIIGASGCGKSTVLKMIAGLEQPSVGMVIKPATVAMVFQNGALLPWLTVEQNVAVVLAQTLSAEKKKEVVSGQLKLLGLQAFAKNYPRELSGGQRQRVGIARALAVGPGVLLLDEPFSALDEETTHELHEDLLRIWRETGVTVVMVSHSIVEAVALAQTIYFMKKGSIAETFPIRIEQPRHEQGELFMHEVQKVRRAFFAAK